MISQQTVSVNVEKNVTSYTEEAIKDVVLAGVGDVDIRAANKIPVNILGAFKATFSGMSPKNDVVSCNGTIYVSDSITVFFFE